MDPDDLADRMKHFYDRCKLFPEDSPQGIINLIELRALAPAAIEMLHELAAFRSLSVVRPDEPAC